MRVVHVESFHDLVAEAVDHLVVSAGDGVWFFCGVNASEEVQELLSLGSERSIRERLDVLWAGRGAAKFVAACFLARVRTVARAPGLVMGGVDYHTWYGGVPERGSELEVAALKWALSGGPRVTSVGELRDRLR
ncbi:MAG: hypothetical protein ACLGIK_06435 [Gemmatimonadota bacterium]